MRGKKKESRRSCPRLLLFAVSDDDDAGILSSPSLSPRHDRQSRRSREMCVFLFQAIDDNTELLLWNPDQWKDRVKEKQSRGSGPVRRSFVTSNVSQANRLSSPVREEEETIFFAGKNRKTSLFSRHEYTRRPDSESPFA